MALPVAVDAGRPGEPPAHVEQHRRLPRVSGVSGMVLRPLRSELPRRDQQAVPAGALAHAAVYMSAGTSCSDGVSEPCMPVSADSRGSALVATMARDPAGAATTSPIRLVIAASTGPNQPSLIASSLDSTQARSPSASRQAASRSAAAPRRAYR